MTDDFEVVETKPPLQGPPVGTHVEPEFAETLVEGLRERGHSVDVGSRTWSSAQAIVIDAATRDAAGEEALDFTAACAG